MLKGSSSSSVEIPEYIETAVKNNLARGDMISQIGAVPQSYGPTRAAFTAPQIAAFNNTSDLASAFGMRGPGNFSMGAPTDYGGGIQAYSAMPLYNQTMQEFRADRPGQAAYIDSFFIDPFSGAQAAYDATAGVSPPAPVVDRASLNNESQSTFDKVPLDQRTQTFTPYTETNLLENIVDPLLHIDNFGNYSPTSVNDVINAYQTLPGDVLPTLTPSSVPDGIKVGDIVDNAAVKAAQNQAVVDAFANYNPYEMYNVTNPNEQGFTPAQVAAANPAFNLEAATRQSQNPVTYVDANTGQLVTTGASDLTTADFNNALGSGTGQSAFDKSPLAFQQYDMAGRSLAGAGIRNIGGDYAQTPTGGNPNDIVMTQYNPATKQSEVVSVQPAFPVENIANEIFTLNGLLGAGVQAPLPTSVGRGAMMTEQMQRDQRIMDMASPDYIAPDIDRQREADQIKAIVAGNFVPRDIDDRRYADSILRSVGVA